jgi:hypothetical protein
MLSATGDAPAGLGKFLCDVETDLRIAKATLGGELGSVYVPAAGRQSWSRLISTASSIVPSADKFRTSKQRELRAA